MFQDFLFRNACVSLPGSAIPRQETVMHRPRRWGENPTANARRGGLSHVSFPRKGTSGRPPTANTHDRKVTVSLARGYQSAIAAYWVTLVGAAVMSAGGRHASFDSISRRRRLQTMTSLNGADVGRHGHGNSGNREQPCPMRSGVNPHQGAYGNERHNLNLARRLMRPQKCGRVMRGNLD